MFSNVKSRSFQSCLFLLQTSPFFNAKHFSTKPLLKTPTITPKQLRKSVILDKSNHRLVYKFSYVPFLAGFMKSKISIPIAALSLAPFMCILDKTYVSSCITILSGTLHYCVGLLVSKFTANVVGKIYVNKEDEIKEVIVSSVDEFGRRIDRIHKVEDLINIDYPNKFSQILGFIAVGVENSNTYYKINIKSCKFIDENACDYVFGFTQQSIVNETSEYENKNKKKVENIDKRLLEK